jgi:hypothetical protein
MYSPITLPTGRKTSVLDIQVDKSRRYKHLQNIFKKKHSTRLLKIMRKNCLSKKDEEGKKTSLLCFVESICCFIFVTYRSNIIFDCGGAIEL